MIMHPEWVAGADKMNPYSLRNICGNPADTTVSVAYMMYTGIFDRFPNLKLHSCTAAVTFHIIWAVWTRG